MGKIQVSIVTIEGNIGAGKTTLLPKFEQSLSSEDKVAIKVEHKPVKEFQSFIKIHWNTFIRIMLTMPLSSKIMY